MAHAVPYLIFICATGAFRHTFDGIKSVGGDPSQQAANIPDVVAHGRADNWLPFAEPIPWWETSANEPQIAGQQRNKAREEEMLGFFRQKWVDRAKNVSEAPPEVLAILRDRSFDTSFGNISVALAIANKVYQTNAVTKSLPPASKRFRARLQRILLDYWLCPYLGGDAYHHRVFKAGHKRRGSSAKKESTSKSFLLTCMPLLGDQAPRVVIVVKEGSREIANYLLTLDKPCDSNPGQVPCGSLDLFDGGLALQSTIESKSHRNYDSLTFALGVDSLQVKWKDGDRGKERYYSDFLISGIQAA